MIFDIQRFSTHDGDGIRTIVFFKGCPLRCTWCENPESQAIQPELLFDPRHCIECSSCLQPAAHGLMHRDQHGRIAVVRPLPAAGPANGSLTVSGTTPATDAVTLNTVAGLCPSLAIRVAGRKMSVEEVIVEVMKDEVFFRNSGGGVTFSGGEPLLQSGFLLELVTVFTGLGLDCAMETCLAAGAGTLEPFLDFPLTWLVDLKHTDAQVFREGTGGELSVVQANMERLADSGAKLVFRVPVIPGFNDDDRVMSSILEYAVELSRKAGRQTEVAGAKPGVVSVKPHLDLLPYHELAAGKYAALGRTYPYARGLAVSKAFLEHHAKAGTALGLEIAIGG
ncbi:MAG: radical SAM protein [Spirochaetota bacterium]